MRRVLPFLVFLSLVASLGLPTTAAGPLPNRPDSLKFAVIGDNGTGDQPQYDVARQMDIFRRQFAYDLVLMLGDNFYGSQRPKDLVKKFETPYKPLLDAGVKFHAAIGNHDEPDSINYPPIGMDGRRYYTFTSRNVRFVVLDTNNLDREQVAWAETTLKDAGEEWKICYFHHPLYSNAGRHGSSVDLRVLLEPILVRTGVDVVLSGHDHLYERIKPQKGIYYFVSGSGGKLRRGDLQSSPETAAAYDRDQSFMLFEVSGPEMFFQVVSRTGATVDSGQITLSNPGTGP
jgi:predicted phosphodiesterase